MEYMLQNHVFPLFSSDLGYMRARVCFKDILISVSFNGKLYFYNVQCNSSNSSSLMLNVNVVMAAIMCVHRF